jgi:hypothetical protein
VFVTYSIPAAVTMTFTGPTTLQKGRFIATFSQPVIGVSTSTFTVVQVGTIPIPGTVSCRNAANAVVDCAAGPVSSATLTATAALIAGEYYFININPSSSPPGVAPYPGGGTLAATFGYVRAPTTVTAFQYPTQYTWGTVKHPFAQCDSFVAERYPGATLTLKGSGSSVALVMWAAPDGGTATVAVATKHEPTVYRTIDSYAPDTGDVTTTIDGLSAGQHTITISVDGVANPSSTGTWVRLDATIINGVFKAKPKTTAFWPNYPGEYAFSATKGATVSFRSRGTGVSWTALTGPNDGKARVTIDGVVVGTQDLYRPDYGYTTFTYDGFFDTFHTIVVTHLGTKNSHSTDTVISVQSFTAL